MSSSPRTEPPLQRLKRLRAQPTEQKVGRGQEALHREPGAVERILEFPSDGGAKGAKAPAASEVVELDAAGERLAAGGWQPNERLGKTIWRDPQDGLWVSQEMALRLSGERGEAYLSGYNEAQERPERGWRE